MRELIMAAIVCLWGVCLLSEAGEPPPQYEKNRRAELKKLALDSNYDCYCALLKLASEDPKEAAEGARMMAHRIEIGRSGIAFFNLDIVLGYRLFKDRFTPEQQQKVEKWLLGSIKPGSWHYRNRFCHMNDNWPFVTAYMMIIGGETIGRDDLAQEGTVRLESYLDISRQMGLGGEYNSATYNPLSLSCLEAVASLSSSLRARVVARVITERLWSEIAARYHAPSSQFAAPQSRAYMADTLCGPSALRYTLHPLLPGGVLIDLESFPELKPSLQSIAEESLVRHFLDPHLVAICEHKTFPYLVQARKYRPFRMEGRDRWPGGFFDTVTYMTARYTVGSAQRTFCGGNGTAPFQVHWTKVPKASQPGHVHTLYTRYRANDELPAGKHVYKENGYIHPVQDRNTTIVLYRPKLALNGKMKSLCASALVPKPGEVDAFYAGNPPRQIDEFPLSSDEPLPVFVRDGGVYIAVHPLAVTDRGRKEAMRVETADDHLIVSYYNLQKDKEHTWTEEEFLSTRNGFVIEVGDAAEYDSFDGFVDAVGSPRIQDTLKDGVRTVDYTREGRTMRVSQRVATHEFLSREFDGEQYQGPLLRTPHQVASLDDTLSVGGATLRTAQGEPKWLTVEPTTGSYVVLYPFRWPFPLHLETPKGEVRCEKFAMGRVVYRPGDATRLVIDCARMQAPLLFTKPEGEYVVILNDEDVTDRVTGPEDGFLKLAPAAKEETGAVAPATTELRVAFLLDCSALARGEAGQLVTTVSNVGGTPACDVIVAPYFSGFARTYLPLARCFAELQPGSSTRVSWGVKGQAAPRWTRLTATAANAPPVCSAIEAD